MSASSRTPRPPEASAALAKVKAVALVGATKIPDVKALCPCENARHVPGRLRLEIPPPLALAAGRQPG